MNRFKPLLVTAIAVVTVAIAGAGIPADKIDAISIDETDDAGVRELESDWIDREKAAATTFDESVPMPSVSQEAALIARDRLMASDGFSVRHDGRDVYPDDFCGYFIGDDDLLHVRCLEEAVERYTQIFSSTDAVVIETADYAYNDLRKGVDELLLKNEDINKAYVDVYTNKAVIGVSASSDVFLRSAQASVDDYVDQLSADTREAFVREETDIPIEIIEAEPVPACSELWSGDAIGKGTIGFTLGATGYYDGEPAIVTCGHDLSSGSRLHYNGVRIGTVSFHRFMNDAYGDYSIIPLSDTPHEITNKAFGPAVSTSYPIRVSGSVDSADWGETVYRYGHKSKWSVGKVLKTDVSVRVNPSHSPSCLIHGHTEARFNKKAIDGDSGGPIYVYRGGYRVCGITSGGDKTGGTLCYYTPFELILDKGFVVKTD